MQDLNLIAISQDLNNWLPVTEIPKHYPQFNYPTLKAMFWKRAEKPGLGKVRISHMAREHLYQSD